MNPVLSARLQTVIVNNKLAKQQWLEEKPLWELHRKLLLTHYFVEENDVVCSLEHGEY